MKELFYTVIPNFTNSIIVANKVRVKPYRKGFKTPALPLKYSNFIGDKYFWNGKGYLINMLGELVPSNANKAGLPRLWQINGQDIFNDTIKYQARNDYMDKLKAYIRPYIEDMAGFIVNDNMMLHLLFFKVDKTLSGGKEIDNDNKWIWEKAIGDVMKSCLIKEDDPHILPAHYKRTRFITDESEQRLEIRLYQLTD